MLSPLRLLSLGLAADDVCTLYGLTPEELDMLAEEAEARRREYEPAPSSAGRKLMNSKLMNSKLMNSKLMNSKLMNSKLMTVLLRREDLPGYRFRQTRKQAQ